MNLRIPLAIGLAVTLVAAGLTWLWFDQMEKRWTAKPQISRAAAENPMLAATLLLRQDGRPVKVAGSFGEISFATLPPGTLIIANSTGITSPAAAEAMLAWVRRGNTLVTEPRWAHAAERAALLAGDPELAARAADEAGKLEEAENGGDSAASAKEEKEDSKASAPPAPPLIETDPLAARFGVRQLYLYRMPKCSERADATGKAERKAVKPAATRRHCIPASEYVPRLLSLVPPDAPYALTLDESNVTLETMPGAAAPLWADAKADGLRVYGEGKGKVVMMAANYFNNVDLKNYDHAEVLLLLASLSQTGKHVTIVQMLDVLPWYVALWQHYRYLLIALACMLALGFWMAVRRFGPVLPQPAAERRSLMEHIAASGAWLWKADGGSALLLAAAREETLALLRRRAPGLLRLPPQEQAGALARDTGIDPEQLVQALQADAAQHPARFTRQIRTLQELRNHYER